MIDPIAFRFLLSTKGAHRYFEVDSNGEKRGMKHPDCVIGTLYIRKSAMLNPPELLKIIIEGD